MYTGAADEGGGARGALAPPNMYLRGLSPPPPPKFSDRSDDDMLPYISTCTPLACLMYQASSRGYICLQADSQIHARHRDATQCDVAGIEKFLFLRRDATSQR